MSKLLTGLVVLWIVFTFIQGVMDGDGGFNSTKLNGDLSASATTITVDDTTGFTTTAGNRVIFIGDEEITYNGITPTTFTGATRGTNGTEAIAHNDNSQVYSRDSGTLNRGLNFNLGSTGSTTGNFAVVTTTLGFFAKSLPNLLLWNFSFFSGPLVMARLLLFAISIG